LSILEENLREVGVSFKIRECQYHFDNLKGDECIFLLILKKRKV